MDYITCQCGQKLAKTSNSMHCKECNYRISLDETCPDCGSATYCHVDPGYDFSAYYCLHSDRFISNIYLIWDDLNNPSAITYQRCNEIIQEREDRMNRALEIQRRRDTLEKVLKDSL